MTGQKQEDNTWSLPSSNPSACEGLFINNFYWLLYEWNWRSQFPFRGRLLHHMRKGITNGWRCILTLTTSRWSSVRCPHLISSPLCWIWAYSVPSTGLNLNVCRRNGFTDFFKENAGQKETKQSTRTTNKTEERAETSFVAFVTRKEHKEWCYQTGGQLNIASFCHLFPCPSLRKCRTNTGFPSGHQAIKCVR